VTSQGAASGAKYVVNNCFVYDSHFSRLLVLGPSYDGTFVEFLTDQ